MMKVSHEEAVVSTSQSAMDRLKNFLTQRRGSIELVKDMENFERELHGYFVEAEREVLAEELGRFDIDLPAVRIAGEVYRQVVRCEESYVSAVGPVRVLRSLYGSGRSGERALCPLELRAGIVEGRWTPLAARQASFVVAHMTPQEGEDLFRELGNMQPSKSSLDRLPKQLSARWEAERLTFESALREQESVPGQAVTMAISLDGVMVPMKDGARQQKRDQAQAEGKDLGGPRGYQEVGCGTVSFYDAQGNRLLTRRMARMPEAKKASLKTTLSEEIATALQQRPDLTLVKLADGAKDNSVRRYLLVLSSSIITMPVTTSKTPSMRPMGRSRSSPRRSSRSIGISCAMKPRGWRKSYAHWSISTTLTPEQRSSLPS